MKIGTWNLDGKWGDGQRDLLQSQDCDVWLLTEVNTNTKLAGYHLHATKDLMLKEKPEKHWAAILSRSPLKALDDPHPASAAAIVGTTMYCSTVLPWGSCGNQPPWVGESLAEKTASTLNTLLEKLPRTGLVWGGDWNNELNGRTTPGAGSAEGQSHIHSALAVLNLDAPTRNQPHRLGCGSIDHVAVPKAWQVRRVCVILANELSSHDAYIVDVIALDNSSPKSNSNEH